MKRSLIINCILSIIICFLLKIFTVTMSLSIHQGYYLAIGFYLLLYLLQSFFLARQASKKESFVLWYNLTTILKMVSSSLFIFVYIFFFTDEQDFSGRFSFVLYYIVVYFVYLIINTTMFSSEINRKK